MPGLRYAMLRLQHLEDRLAPALTFKFDYRFDTHGFFSDPQRREVLEQAGRDLTSRIADTPQAIIPSATNGWTAMLFHPATGESVSLPNLTVSEGHMVVFVAGRDFTDGEAGEGGPGGYSVGGSAAWRSLVGTRGVGSFSVWGGSIGFQLDSTWSFAIDDQELTGAQKDFYSVAAHELGHILGFGASSAYLSLVSDGTYSGSAAIATNQGLPPLLSSDRAHFAADTLFEGRPVAMQPYLQPRQRIGFTELDYAVLDDIGWTITPGFSQPPVISPVSAPPAPGLAFTISGGAGGVYSTYAWPSGTSIPVLVGSIQQPFPDYTGALRTALADVNGDGTDDVAAVTGVGGPSRLRILDGRSGADLLPPLAVFGTEFTGGLFVAAADLSGDGRAEVIVSPDRGGGARVSIFNLTDSVIRVGDFFGIEDVNFRGGARVAAADLNGDSTPDLIVGAGFGGGPRIALFDGTAIRQARPRKLVGDFFAFPGADALALRNGVYVATGDLNGDGRADLVFGAGPGGGPRVYALDTRLVLSGELDHARFTPLANFFAFDIEDRGGVQVAVRDFNGDGWNDLIASSGTRRAVRLFSGASATWTGDSPGAGLTLNPTGLQGDLEGVFVG